MNNRTTAAANSRSPAAPRSKPGSECHIIVGVSTPQTGGMATHMALLSDGLAEESLDVHVWSPAETVLDCRSAGVKIHKTLGQVSIRDLRETGRCLNRFSGPRRLLVYWVPHAYGYRSMNLHFCLWLWFRSAWREDRIELMVQECFLSFTRDSWKQSAAALVHRVMTTVLLRAADQVWIALSGYERLLKPFALARRIRFGWLPVPSNVGVFSDPPRVAEIRARLAPDGFLIGHFGTFGRHVADLMENIVPELMHGVGASLVLLGSGGEAFRERLLQTHPDLAPRIHATGFLDDTAISSYFSACDVMIQPYPDGLTARRGSSLAPLAHGRPIVTNATPETEPFWSQTSSVVFAPATGAGFLEAVRELKTDDGLRQRVGQAAKEIYARYFDPAHMIETIQAPQP